MSLVLIKKELDLHSNKEKARNYARFFKTSKGEYGEGDRFIGVVVPVQRKIAKKYYKDLSLAQIQKLISSPIHEYRLTALMILTYRYPKSTDIEREEMVKFYLKNTKYINNWDLVDCSAHKIIGAWLLKRPEQKKVLYELAKSKNLWERRIAIISTFAFIKESQFDDALKISMILLYDKHDLIHKAVGWMLREVGKKNQAMEEEILKRYCQIMPRTMLRYAIEHFSEEKRRFYMVKKMN
ncbi:MAG: DNA alkylation repair protein [Candidatus Paceibacterota bacterium]|jgi:3-methyladenine DNA glycosylase AlkD